MGSCLLSNFRLFGIRFVRYFTAMWWMAFIVILMMFGKRGGG